MTCIATRQPHALTEIMRRSSAAGPGIDQVVRWCRDCGAVVVDTDVDGRTQPGDWIPMRFPTLARRMAPPHGTDTRG